MRRTTSNKWGGQAMRSTARRGLGDREYNVTGAREKGGRRNGSQATRRRRFCWPGNKEYDVWEAGQ